jgi:hypothetical protein
VNPLESLNRESKTINGVQWRQFCGWPSEERWAKYRSIVGAKGRSLTPYEAMMLWALRHWRVICKDIGEVFRVEEDICVVESKLSQWLIHNMKNQGLAAVDKLTTLNSVEGRHIPVLVQLLLGKSISERSLYRIGQTKGMPRFSLTQKYSKAQVQKYLGAIALT